MTVNLYNTGVSGLLASQQQLATTGHNIANVNTEGYTRQRAEQNASVGLFTGGNYIGSGTYVQDVVRVYNEFSYKEQLLSQSNLGNANAAFAHLDQLNDMMSVGGQSVMSSIELFYQAMNGIADSPSDLSLRSIALNQAEILNGDFQSLNQNVEKMEKAVNGEIQEIAKKITDISGQLAQINEKILFGKDLTLNGQPNDLLDTRDRLINELGEYTSVNTVTDPNGVMTVMIGQGSTLVAGITPMSLTVTAGDPDPLKTEVQLAGPNSAINLDGKSLGGALSAKFEFRDEHIAQTKAEINRLAMVMMSTLNDVQGNGLDLNRQQGANIFTDINATTIQESRVLASANNTGNVQAHVNITDVSLVPTDEFSIRFDGTDYQMTNKTTGAVTTLVESPPGTFATAHGFEFNIDSGAPATEDTFTIRPTQNAISLSSVAMTDGSGIAASSAVDITPSDNNVSTGKVEIVNMLDPVSARAAMPMRIDVLESPPGTFSYTYTDNAGVTSAPIGYTPPAQTIDLPPSPATTTFQIEISGTPSGSALHAPEQFHIRDAFGVGNGANAVDMALTQEQQIINGENETFGQAMASSVSEVGSKAASAELTADTATALFTQAFNRNQQTSGVNLDEEAANLLKFQQAYQAASQIISVANTIFDTLLAAAR
jgi:flagellar hook-associated protein 1 FlgK